MPFAPQVSRSTHSMGRVRRQMLPRVIWVLFPHYSALWLIPVTHPGACRTISSALLPQPQHEMHAECALMAVLAGSRWFHLGTFIYIYGETSARFLPPWFPVILHFSFYTENKISQLKRTSWKPSLLEVVFGISSRPMLGDRCHLQPLKPCECSCSVPTSPRLKGVVARSGHKAAALPDCQPSIWERRTFLKVGLLGCKCERRVPEHTASGLCLICSILITVQPLQFIPTPRAIATPSILLLWRCCLPEVRRH